MIRADNRLGFRARPESWRREGGGGGIHTMKLGTHLKTILDHLFINILTILGQYL